MADVARMFSLLKQKLDRMRKRKRSFLPRQERRELPGGSGVARIHCRASLENTATTLKSGGTSSINALHASLPGNSSISSGGLNTSHVAVLPAVLDPHRSIIGGMSSSHTALSKTTADSPQSLTVSSIAHDQENVFVNPLPNRSNDEAIPVAWQFQKTPTRLRPRHDGGLSLQDALKISPPRSRPADRKRQSLQHSFQTSPTRQRQIHRKRVTQQDTPDNLQWTSIHDPNLHAPVAELQATLDPGETLRAVYGPCEPFRGSGFGYLLDVVKTSPPSLPESSSSLI